MAAMTEHEKNEFRKFLAWTLKDKDAADGFECLLAETSEAPKEAIRWKSSDLLLWIYRAFQAGKHVALLDQIERRKARNQDDPFFELMDEIGVSIGSMDEAVITKATQAMADLGAGIEDLMQALEIARGTNEQRR